VKKANERVATTFQYSSFSVAEAREGALRHRDDAAPTGGYYLAAVVPTRRTIRADQTV
jgi:hypothetical protein